MKRLALLILLWGCASAKPSRDSSIWLGCKPICAEDGAIIVAVIERIDDVKCVCQRLPAAPAGT